MHRSAPEQSFEWGTDTVISVRFNPGQPDILATSARYALKIVNKIFVKVISTIKNCKLDPLVIMFLFIINFRSE